MRSGYLVVLLIIVLGFSSVSLGNGLKILVNLEEDTQKLIMQNNNKENILKSIKYDYMTTNEVDKATFSFEKEIEAGCYVNGSGESVVLLGDLGEVIDGVYEKNSALPDEEFIVSDFIGIAGSYRMSWSDGNQIDLETSKEVGYEMAIPLDLKGFGKEGVKTYE